jgi:peptidoglycan hydrolase CwlO-like protein
MVVLELMKRRSTTPVSIGIVTKSALVATAVLMVMAAPLATMQKVNADRYDDQINALRQQANQAQDQANQKQAEANTLAAKLQQLTDQKNAIQAQVTISQQQYDTLQQQIKDTQQKVADNKDALGTTMADLYVDGTISPLEMLASSKNIGDYVDKQTYQSSVRDTLSQTIKTIQDLQAKLQKAQQEVKTVLDKQTAQKNSLVAVEAQQQVLLDQTKGEEAAYQQQVSSAQSQIAAVSAQQNSYYQSLIRRGGSVDSGVVGSFQYTNWSGDMGCSGGYSYCGSPDSQVDPWGLYNRECVSYVAWALANRFHKYVANFNGQGNAYQWPSSAPAYSGAYRVSDPQPGDAVILPADSGFAPIGHAMVVESSGGGWVHVSQYNMYGTHGYSTMDIKASGVIFLRFPSA